MALRRNIMVAGLTLLAACGGGTTDPLAAGQAPCPRIAILADGADLTRFRPGAGRDLTAMVADARIAGFDAQCDYASRDRRRLAVRLTPRFEAERGPAAETRTLDLPWFVVLTDASDSDVLERQAFTTRIAYAANAPRATTAGQTARLSLPIGEGVSSRDYTVRLSLQLSADELALNRTRGAR